MKVPNEVIIGIVFVVIIVVAARKWDTLKWWIGLALVGLALWTAFEMGVFDPLINKVDVPSVEFK